MKILIEGVWHANADDTPALRLARAEEAKRFFRSAVTADGSSGFQAEPGRYHLYVSYACPWAHRTILYRRLKGLDGVISMSVVHPVWTGEHGWCFFESDLSTTDEAAGFDYLYQAYQAAKPDFTGKVTVPVLWDKQARTIVNNQSGEIIRMLNSAFDTWGNASLDFYPEDRRDDIETLNTVILERINMGVYAAGFASTQETYDRAVKRLFDTLDQLEDRLADRPYLLGDRVTETDWHLFATLVRFDTVYNPRLKCSIKRLVDYPNLSHHTCRLYDIPGVADTVKLDHVKRHYWDDLGIGELAIQPADPAVDFRNVA